MAGSEIPGFVEVPALTTERSIMFLPYEAPPAAIFPVAEVIPATPAPIDEPPPARFPIMPEGRPVTLSQWLEDKVVWHGPVTDGPVFSE